MVLVRKDEMVLHVLDTSIACVSGRKVSVKTPIDVTIIESAPAITLAYLTEVRSFRIPCSSIR